MKTILLTLFYIFLTYTFLSFGSTRIFSFWLFIGILGLTYDLYNYFKQKKYDKA